MPARPRAVHPLPDFCRVATLLEVVVLAEGLALIFSLLPGRTGEGFWQALGLYSLYIQWIALTGVALLCLLRPLLLGMTWSGSAAIGLGLMAVVTAAVSELSYKLYLAPQVFPLEGHAAFILRAVLISLLLSAVVMRYFMVQQRWRRDVEAVQQARMAALQSRIQPHFLFNSLNTIASLIPEQPHRAEGLIEDLSDLFRASLAGERPLHLLQEELELTRAYLNLEQQRLGERLRVDWQVGEVPVLQVPPLILQPLVENAVRHGIEPLPGGGELKVSLSRRPGQLCLCVENHKAAGEGEGGSGYHIGLANVEERLHTLFGARAGLWKYDEGERFKVEMSLPVEDAV